MLHDFDQILSAALALPPGTRAMKILLYLKLNPKEISNPPSISRDVSSIGHFGTGDFEITVASPADLPVAKEFIDIAYQRIGG